MNEEGTRTPSYVELSSQTYALFVEAFASANHRALGFAKAVVELTVNELQASGQKNAEFAENLAAHAAKVQDSWTHTLRGLLTTGISNLTYVKESTETSFDGFARRVEHLQPRVTKVSSN
jgi:hypothetical protein